jgi:hypothetical protein
MPLHHAQSSTASFRVPASARNGLCPALISVLKTDKEFANISTKYSSVQASGRGLNT